MFPNVGDVLVPSTYKDNFNVVALERLEKVCNPIFQTSTDEDPFVEVIQKDGSESIYVTLKKNKTKQIKYVPLVKEQNGKRRKSTYSLAMLNHSLSSQQKPYRLGQTE